MNLKLHILSIHIIVVGKSFNEVKYFVKKVKGIRRVGMIIFMVLTPKVQVSQPLKPR